MLRFAVVLSAFPTQAGEVSREHLQCEAALFNGIIIFRREHNSGISRGIRTFQLNSLSYILSEEEEVSFL